jgi:hypothetical protein
VLASVGSSAPSDAHKIQLGDVEVGTTTMMITTTVMVA